MIQHLNFIDHEFSDVEPTAASLSSESVLYNCLAAAVRAPSGDNRQPWHFEVNSIENKITVYVDKSRDTSPMNSGQKMARIACGAAIENIFVTAEASGGRAVLERDCRSEVAATIRVIPGAGRTVLPKAVFDRTTNRRIYVRLPIAQKTLEALVAATGAFEGIHTYWVCHDDRMSEMAKTIGKADALMFSNDSIRHAFLSNVRFDCPASEAVEEGLSLSSLELSLLRRTGLHSMQFMPSGVLSACRTFELMGAHAQKLVESASGVCVITAPSGTDRACVNAGRAMQRAWLELTKHGLAAQPMMSLLVLANAMEHGSAEFVASLDQLKIERLLQDFCTQLNADGKPLFVLRFGYAQAPSGKTGRRTTTEVYES